MVLITLHATSCANVSCPKKENSSPASGRKLDLNVSSLIRGMFMSVKNTTGKRIQQLFDVSQCWILKQKEILCDIYDRLEFMIMAENNVP